MSEPTDDQTTGFAVFGLYHDRVVPQVILATDKADARRQYHDMHPGMEGTTFTVKELSELMEPVDD